MLVFVLAVLQNIIQSNIKMLLSIIVVVATKRLKVRIDTNGSGIAEGRDLEAQCFNLAQIPNRSTKD